MKALGLRSALYRSRGAKWKALSDCVSKGIFNVDTAALPDALDLILITLILWVVFGAVALFIMKRF
jgi:hypothetical protein